MSNFLAIATVTAALSQVVQAAIGIDVSGATVSTERPDRAGAGVSAAKVNVFLYQVTTNTAWRNADLPTRRADGHTAQRPQAALDLHYLLTFYGDEVLFEPQRLLGSAVRALHARPVLTRQMIRDAVLSFSMLVNSDLAEAAELVKFTPIPLTLEELSKLWSVFFQTPYALSIAYQGTVVLIEGRDIPQTALPVRQRNIYGVTFRQPVVERVHARDQAEQPIVAGDTLAIVGKQLRGDDTQVRIGESQHTPAPQDVGEEQISLPLPLGLQAGVHGLQVVQPMLLGTPAAPHRGVESNVTPFVLHPTIARTNGSHDITISNLQVTRNDTRAADIDVKLDPEVGRRQRVLLLLNEFEPPTDRAARAYSFDAPSRNQPDAADRVGIISVPISGVVPGQYLVRVQVDGAESALEVDTDEASPSFNQLSKPSVSIA